MRAACAHAHRAARCLKTPNAALSNTDVGMHDHHRINCVVVRRNRNRIPEEAAFAQFDRIADSCASHPLRPSEKPPRSVAQHQTFERRLHEGCRPSSPRSAAPPGVAHDRGPRQVSSRKVTIGTSPEKLQLLITTT